MTSGNLKKGNEKDTKEATHNRKIYHSRDSQREIDELCYVHKHSKKNEKQKKKKSILIDDNQIPLKYRVKVSNEKWEC